jgi:hypothetical protein
MTDTEFRSMANEVALAFASVPSLIGKIWLDQSACERQR